ncbi:MAG: protein kinase domain-containing protein [Rhizobacter sp.]
MALTPGTRIGVYDISAQIGEGGMGAVYRATDTSLGRQVAIKVLPDAFAQDAERLARFEHEARTLAALNHPHIAAIYAVEKSGGMRALVMELVEGDDLSQRIARGPIPVDEALPIAKQMADALEAAHEQGIIHRDLKPANIKVRTDGTVKVLDFGLAKAMEPAAGSPGALSLDASQAPTITSPAMTQIGVILGTAAYMAPEQARGRTVDRRADIWAFGVVLYEMLAGRRPFDGDDVSITLANVLKDNVQWDALPADVPASIRRLLRRCLEKDPKRRLGAISDARLEVDDAAADVSDTVAAPHVAGATARPRWLSISAVIGSLIAAVAMSALGTWFLTRPLPTPARVERFVITTPPDAPPAVAGVLSLPAVAISPDGSRIVYRSQNRGTGTRLWVRDRGSLEIAAIPGADGGAQVFWSPDGKWMAFFSISDATLKRMPALGGPAEVVCKVLGQPAGASWGADDSIVFATSTSKGLLRVPAAGGEPQVFTTVDATNGETHRWPEVLPDGKGVVFTAWGGSPERSRIALVSTSDRRISTLVAGGTYPRYAKSGHLLFALAGTLRAVRFDPTRLAVIGDPVRVLDDLGITTVGAAHYAIGGDGALGVLTPRSVSD